MSKVPMIFKIKLTVEETKNKIRVREKSHGKPCNRPPISIFSIIDSLGNDPAGKHQQFSVSSQAIEILRFALYHTRFRASLRMTTGDFRNVILKES